MLDIRLLRENPEVVRANLARRRDPAKLDLLDRVIAWDAEWRRHLKELEELRHRRNVVSQEIGAIVKEGKDATAAKAEAAALPGSIRNVEARVEELRGAVDDAMHRIPNLLHESVPDGAGPQDNVVLRAFGTAKPADPWLRPHAELIEALALADFENVMYKIDGDDAFLIATSEHAMAAMFKDEILDESRLPLRFAGLSTNFRREIGAHGVDTKGLFRVHQFNKVEQFAFAPPETSWAIHEEFLKNVEDVFRSLDIPHRVVVLCSADTGNPMAKTIDIEAWYPRQDAYREIASCSNP